MTKNRSIIAADNEKDSGTTDQGTEDMGVLLGSAYDFLFEGENNEYDEEFRDYI